MKLIIAGGRDISPDLGFIHSSIKMLGITNITEVVCGGATGVDTEGAHWASHMEVPVKYFRADWEQFGKQAGPIRNIQMAEYGDVLLLIWDGESRGSYSMKTEMEKVGKPIYEVILKRA
jgi:hypothetical protein